MYLWLFLSAQFKYAHLALNGNNKISIEFYHYICNIKGSFFQTKVNEKSVSVI